MHRLLFRTRASLLTAALMLALPWGAALAQAADTVAEKAPVLDSGATKAQRAAVKQQRDAERARITAERKAIQQRRSQEEAACYKRFAVEDCLSATRTRARLADNALRDQESAINAVERREKSAARLLSIEQKVEEKNQQTGPKPGVEGKVRAPKSPTVPASALPAAPTAKDLVEAQALRAQQARERAQAQSQHEQSHTAEQARKQASEAERRAASRQRYEEKQREAQQNRERQRAKALESDKPKAAPLPRAAP